MNDNEDKYLKAIEKLATGYEYEETQTLIEETTTGTKKKVIRYKKTHGSKLSSCYLFT